MRTETRKLPELYDGATPIIRDAQQAGQLVEAIEFIEYLATPDNERPQDIRCLVCDNPMSLFLRAQETGKECYFKHHPGATCALLKGANELRIFNAVLMLTKALRGKQGMQLNSKCTYCRAENKEWFEAGFEHAAAVAANNQIVLLSGTGAPRVCLEVYSGFAIPSLPWALSAQPTVPTHKLNLLDLLSYVDMRVSGEGEAIVLTLVIPIGKTGCISCHDRIVALEKMRQLNATPAAERALELVMMVETGGASLALAQAPNAWDDYAPYDRVVFANITELAPELQEQIIELDVDTFGEIKKLLKQRKREQAGV